MRYNHISSYILYYITKVLHLPFFLDISFLKFVIITTFSCGRKYLLIK